MFCRKTVPQAIIKHLTEFNLEFKFWKTVPFFFGLRNWKTTKDQQKKCSLFCRFCCPLHVPRTGAFCRPFHGPWTYWSLYRYRFSLVSLCPRANAIQHRKEWLRLHTQEGNGKRRKWGGGGGWRCILGDRHTGGNTDTKNICIITKIIIIVIYYMNKYI